MHTNKAKNGNKSSFLMFSIVAPPQKLVVAPGATIRDNTVSLVRENICDQLL